MKHRLCLFTAVEVEFRTAASLLSSPLISIDQGFKIACQGEIAIVKTEIGAPSFAEKFSAHLSTHSYDMALVSGFAGALDPRFTKGEIVVYDESIDGRAPHRTVISCDKKLSEKLRFACKAHCGSGLTVSRIVTEVSEKRRFWEDYAAAAVDMETYDLLAVCARHNLSAAVLRIISDEASEYLPDFNRLFRPDGKIIGWRVPSVLATRPRASLRFLASIRPTARALKDALAAAIHALDVSIR